MPGHLNPNRPSPSPLPSPLPCRLPSTRGTAHLQRQVQGRPSLPPCPALCHQPKARNKTQHIPRIRLPAAPGAGAPPPEACRCPGRPSGAADPPHAARDGEKERRSTSSCMGCVPEAGCRAAGSWRAFKPSHPPASPDFDYLCSPPTSSSMRSQQLNQQCELSLPTYYEVQL